MQKACSPSSGAAEVRAPATGRSGRDSHRTFIPKSRAWGFGPSARTVLWLQGVPYRSMRHHSLGAQVSGSEGVLSSVTEGLENRHLSDTVLLNRGVSLNRTEGDEVFRPTDRRRFTDPVSSV